MVTIILSVLAILTIAFLVVLIQDMIAHKSEIMKEQGNLGVALATGAVTNFFDALGIGNFATTTLVFKLTKFLKSDKYLPGTLNVGQAIPVVTEAFFFITVVKVEALTLGSLVASAVVGSILGARVVSKMPEKKIQLIMGIALIVTSVLMALKTLGMLDLLGQGNEALGLSGIMLVIGIVGNFIFGALMTAGVGLYAPCMAMVYMLGLNPLVAFPIMMCSCAALMPTSGIEFVRKGMYSRKAVIGLALGGIPGVIVAATFVKSMNLEVLTWIIIVVVLYTAINMLMSALRKKTETELA
ncbi:sulfite exporter TauE/SafE family protein [Enterococcus rivorum]|uniref:Probable membrane transporter protein n=2 Tax=Enterococcus rivorum TaxID=762845 RepID=A0A1E5KW03_9ENTE|nr:sulfite exporter TauE/SafE family protein [Enterococcus rivorum]OEH82031.1 permease [Enterococcus rivorum]